MGLQGGAGKNAIGKQWFVDLMEYYTHNPTASHRLDRLTSGILILGKTSKAASKLSQQLREKTLTKQYLALVDGVFPE